MRHIGVIAFVQIQRVPLKVMREGRRVYQPAALERMAALRLSERGVRGIDTSGASILDAHHVDHPQSRHRGGANGVSLGFLPHYDAMRARFGPHLSNGIAGENILIESELALRPEDFAEQLIIRPARGGADVYLRDVFAAEPCSEFSAFCAGRIIGGAELAQVLDFLSEGRRGFYATLDAPLPEAEVHPGDMLWIP